MTGALPVPSAGAGSGRPNRMLRQFELVERVKAYQPDADEALINRAYVYAMKMHGAQKRHSGDPYFAHPVEVAGILTDLKLDAHTIVSGLLHDTVEDTPATLEEIEALFGADIRHLVDGVTKLTELELRSESTKQAENLQKFVMATAKDIRVLLVKLADRLHNMRTIHFMPKEESRRRIAQETLDIYGPLARQIGVQPLCMELEDLAFEVLQPEARRAIVRRLDHLRADSGESIAAFQSGIRELMDKEGIPARVSGREKRPYSIYWKLQRKELTFEELTDVYAFRVVVEDAPACYRALGVIHNRWRYVPGRFKDYISMPKGNGYRSLHTSVIGPGGVRAEIQIRTEAMNQVAEFGVAAHWRYKNESYGFDPDAAAQTGGDPMMALERLADMVRFGADPEEFLEYAKLEMYQDQVFVFTPKGELVSLPRGASPIDFAYAVHTDVGDTCVGATINGVERPLRTQLRNGDVIKILRSDAAEIPRNWREIARTGRARSAIRRRVRKAEQKEYRLIGERIARLSLLEHGDDMDDVVLDGALMRLGYDTEKDLFEALGRKDVSRQDFLRAVFPGAAPSVSPERRRLSDMEAPLFLEADGLSQGVSFHFAECCNPLPGERIVGVHAEGRGIDVHVIDCAVLGEAEEKDWIDLAWSRDAGERTVSNARMTITMPNRPGALAEACQIIAEARGNITRVATVQRSETFAAMEFDIDVADAQHLADISARLRASPQIVALERARQEQDA